MVMFIGKLAQEKEIKVVSNSDFSSVTVAYEEEDGMAEESILYHDSAVYLRLVP